MTATPDTTWQRRAGQSAPRFALWLGRLIRDLAIGIAVWLGRFILCAGGGIGAMELLAPPDNPLIRAIVGLAVAVPTLWGTGHLVRRWW